MTWSDSCRWGALATLLWAAAPSVLCAQAPAEAEAEETVEVAAAAEASGEEQSGAAAMRTEGLDDEQARARFRVGQALYMSGRFLEAAEEFESAYRLSGRRSLLFNAYLSFRDAGDLANAVRTLELYLEGDRDAQDAQALSQRLEAMKRTLAENQEAEAESNAAAEAERQRLAEQAAAADRRAARERRRAEEASKRLNPLGWIVGGVGLGIMAGGVLSGVLALGARSDLEANCPDDRCVEGFDLEGEEKSVSRPRLAADILLFTGGATVAVGILLLFVGRGLDTDDDGAEAGTTAGLSCGPTGCTGTLRSTF